ncbi:MAG: HDIG domain-containing protein [Chloroflexi bacterium]|nr:HDIG domain-containing protein [Chloroflexota bacterium]
MLKRILSRLFNWPNRYTVYPALLLLISAILSIAALLIPQTLGGSILTLSEGQVTTQDILSPRAITYDSELLTEQRREAAEDAVLPVYEPPSNTIASTQANLLDEALDLIGRVRADILIGSEEQINQLLALEEISFNEESAQAILSLNEPNWQAVNQDASRVLGLVMSDAVREDTLEETIRAIQNWINQNLSVELNSMVFELVSAFVVPNSFYSEDLTQAEIEAARAAIEPVTRSFQTNQTIVQRGNVLSAEDIEALEILGLVEEQINWQDRVSVIALVIVVLSLFPIYLRFRPDLLKNLRGLTLIMLLFVLFLFSVRISIPGRTVIPYLFPLAGFSLVVSTLFSFQAAIVATIPMSILAAYDLPVSLELTLFYMLSSIFGVLILKRAQRITAYFWAGGAIAVSGSIIILAFRLPDSTTDPIGIATLLGATALNGLAAASITIVLQFFLAQIMGLTTTLQLHEISRPDHPLLQFILRTTPGTYQHSLQIANLAEQAAELIGANALLTRVGSLYHDAGKARFPNFFIENQAPGSPNPHDDLKPLESAQVIIRHVTDGLDLAKKYRLPRRLHDFVLEHHGTLITSYQYGRALEAAGGDNSKVDLESYRYPGPRPQSRETALVMLADGCEARARAERPQTREELGNLINEVVNGRLKENQFDDTEITLKDLKVIAESFSATLRGIYHPRIKYPKFEEKSKPPQK